MAVAKGDVRELLLKVDASVELAKRNLNSLQTQLASDAMKMDASLDKIDKSTARLGGAFTSLKANVAGLAATLTLGAVVNLGRDMLTFADDLATAADQAGISVERYQTLTEALRTLEIDGAKADKIFKVLQATLGEIQSGVENTATKAFDRLGISADVMNGKITTSDQLLDALAGAAKRSGSEAQFAGDLVEIFGRKIGVDLAAALKDGGVALKELEQGIRDSGTVIDQELINKLADANEAIDAFTTRTRRQMVIWAGDFITGMQDAAFAVDGFLAKLHRAAPVSFAFLGGAQKRVAAYESVNAEERVREQKKRVQEAQQNVANTERRVASGIFGEILAGGQSGIASAKTKLREETAELVRRTRILSEQNRRRPAPLPEEPPKPIPRPPEGGGGGKSRSSGARARSTKAPEMTPAELRELANWDVPISFTFDDKPLADLKQIRVELDGIANTDIDLSNVITVEEIERFEHFKDDMALFAGDVLRVGLGFDDWSIEDMGKRLADLIVQLTVVEPIVNRIRDSMAGWQPGSLGGGGGGFFGGLLNIGASLFGGGGGASAGGFNFLGGADPASIFGPMFGGFRAAGGPVDPGKAYVVGEHRAELFVPRVPGRIVPSVGGGAGGSPSVSLTINAPGATAETVAMIRRELAGVVPSIVQASKQATIGALQRPGLA